DRARAGTEAAVFEFAVLLERIGLCRLGSRGARTEKDSETCHEQGDGAHGPSEGRESCRGNHNSSTRRPSLGDPGNLPVCKDFSRGPALYASLLALCCLPSTLNFPGDLRMTASSHDKLGRRERQILEAVYRLGRASASEVQALLPDPPSYSAVRAMLRI